MTWTIMGRLQSSDADQVSLARCRVDVFFEQTDLAASPETSTAEATIQKSVSTRTDESGVFVVRLPDKEQIIKETPIHFVVSAPSGETIGDAWKEPSRAEIPETIQVHGFKLISLEPPKDQPLPQTRHATGRVIERQARPLPSNLKVLLYTRKPGEIKKKIIGEEPPIFVARVDKTGYFSGDIPNDEFESAAAVVTGIPGEIAVGLEEGGLIPQHILLVVDLPESEPTNVKKGDCGCEDSSLPPRNPSQVDLVNAPETYSVDLGTGGCIQFNTPNRTIEEFDFYTVVRTTEPNIRVVTRGGVKPGTPEQSSTPGTKDLAALKETEERLKKEAEAKRAAARVKSDDATAAESRAAAAWAKVSEANREVSKAEEECKKQQEVLGNFDPKTPAWQQAKVKLDSLKAILEQKKEAAQEAKAQANPAASAAVTARSAADTAVADATRAEKEATDAAAAVAAELARMEAEREGGSTKKPPSRMVLDTLNLVDWDSTPTFYEATEIAHGHLLHFKQIWYADGYSLGDLLYSLPLAPGQKKLIAVIDWERRERTERTEATFGSEELMASLSRDRDLGEVVTGALTESSRGGSKNTTVGIGAGTGAAGNGSYQGFNFGALLGVSGGYGESESSAWQDSARNLSSSSLQKLRDRTLQSASAVRGLRSSVVHAVAQGEAVRATTEVVANHNHCHALTIQYFEVLRHLKVKHELTDVQECLFVPFPMAEFNRAKALRWRQCLQTYLQRRELTDGFDAARRVETNWTEVSYPANRYADEKVTSIYGELQLTVIIPLPPFPERPLPKPEDPINSAKAIVEATNPTTGFLGILLAVATGGASLVAGAITGAALTAAQVATQGARNLAEELYAQPTAQERYAKFHHDVMPGVVAGFVDQLQLWALIGNTAVQISDSDVDFTLVSEYQPGIPLLVSVRCALPGQFSRADFKQLMIKSANGLPNGSRAIINSAVIRYQTASFEHALVDDRRVNDDIDLPKVVSVFTGLELNIEQRAVGVGATLYAPIDAWEQRAPRKEDQRLSAELIDHLNENLEFYHHAIWWTMDPNRRYLLLDGFFAPGSNKRSVASVVENRLIGIVGNSLVLPVAHGNHLDPRFGPDKKGKYANLLDFYALESPVPPARVSLPTRGVFAEAVMGSCNACEQIDDSRFWRWEESPIDEPPAIEPASTATRRTQPDAGQPTPFPTPIVSIQNAPSVPDPTGVRAALDALGKQSFADITGLAGTQANAAAAYQQALDTAFKFGKEASTLAQQAAMTKSIDRTMNAIDKAEAGGKIDKDDAKELRVSALKKMVGETSRDDKDSSKAETEQKKAATEVIRKIPAGSVQEIKSKDASGATTTIKAKPISAVLPQPFKQMCGFFGSNVILSETDIRDTIRDNSVRERQDWFDAAGNIILESAHSQFGFLTSYWLSSISSIRPTTLLGLVANCRGYINYGQLLNAGASNAQVNAEAARVRADLLAGVPDVDNPANLNNLIERALKSARLSSLDDQNYPWSAVFIVSCIRETTVQLGLESMSLGAHTGREELLMYTAAHRIYALEAYRRRFGPNQKNGTYHAFAVTERTPQVGDIIIQDRRNGITIDDVPSFEDIPTTLVNNLPTHGDIVVEVPEGEDFVVAIGGNLGNSVRRRRYPLDANRFLVVDRMQLYTQEDDAGNLPTLPAVNNAAGLHTRSTGRIFALLSLVESCAVIPGQQMPGGLWV